MHQPFYTIWYIQKIPSAMTYLSDTSLDRSIRLVNEMSFWMCKCKHLRYLVQCAAAGLIPLQPLCRACPVITLNHIPFSHVYCLLVWFRGEIDEHRACVDENLLCAWAVNEIVCGVLPLQLLCCMFKRIHYMEYWLCSSSILHNMVILDGTVFLFKKIFFLNWKLYA